MRPRGVAGVIGDPVAHSLSPDLHRAGYEALGLDWTYVAFHVPRGRAAEALDAMRVLGLAGLNVTMPHKEAVAATCDELTETARRLQSVNTVVPFGNGRLLGDSTDGEGLVRALAHEGVEIAGRRTVVVGAGGAGRAVALALAAAGAAPVTIWARREDAAASAVTVDPDRLAAVATGEIGPAVAAADLVIHATPLGMHHEDPPLPVASLRAGQVVVDLIYRPAVTPLLAAAAAAGAVAINGLGMLVHQAALAFTLFTSEPAPVGAMWAAATAGGGESGH